MMQQVRDCERPHQISLIGCVDVTSWLSPYQKKKKKRCDICALKIKNRQRQSILIKAAAIVLADMTRWESGPPEITHRLVSRTH